MNIKEFIAETLVQITMGVIEAQNNLKDTGALVNPELNPGQLRWGVGHTLGGELVGAVDFDMAVNATEGTETKGGIGVVAGILSLGSAGKSDASTGSATRIKFSVPIRLPIGKYVIPQHVA
jgi:hypothetical protein